MQVKRTLSLIWLLFALLTIAPAFGARTPVVEVLAEQQDITTRNSGAGLNGVYPSCASVPVGGGGPCGYGQTFTADFNFQPARLEIGLGKSLLADFSIQALIFPVDNMAMFPSKSAIAYSRLYQLLPGVLLGYQDLTPIEFDLEGRGRATLVEGKTYMVFVTVKSATNLGPSSGESAELAFCSGLLDMQGNLLCNHEGRMFKWNGGWSIMSEPNDFVFRLYGMRAGPKA